MRKDSISVPPHLHRLRGAISEVVDSCCRLRLSDVFQFGSADGRGSPKRPRRACVDWSGHRPGGNPEVIAKPPAKENNPVQAHFILARLL